VVRISSIRLGIVTTLLITMALASLSAYLSLNILSDEPLYSMLGVLTSLALVFLSVSMYRGKDWALTSLTLFYIILAIIGLLISTSLPSEGLLTLVGGILMSSYLWRYRSRKGKISQEVLEIEEGEEPGTSEESVDQYFLS